MNRTHLFPRLRHWLLGSALVAGGLCVALPAHANLGDRIALADTRATTVNGVALHFTELDGIRQYVGNDGVVYAVKWDRLAAAPMNDLLGRYITTFDAAMKTRRFTGHNYLHIATPELVVRSFSMPHRKVGQIYLPTQMPKGMTVDALP